MAVCELVLQFDRNIFYSSAPRALCELRTASRNTCQSFISLRHVCLGITSSLLCYIPREVTSMFQIFVNSGYDNKIFSFIFADVSITVTNGIHLAKEGNGSLVPIHKIDLPGAYHQTTRPLVHDPKHDYLYVSGTIQQNETLIYRINLATGHQEKLIITNSNAAVMEGKILGIEHDYVNNVLFWSNGQGGKILKVDLGNNLKQQVIVYDRNIPKLITSGLTLDECSRTLYWTSYVIRDGFGFIESSNVDGSNHIILHRDNLHNPTDITIDQTDRKLYWCDMKEGASFTIERSNLDGSSREKLFGGSGVQPSSMAITNQFIYWINIESEKFERIEKFTNVERTRQDKILDYEADKPRSIDSHKTILFCENDDTMVEIVPFPSHPSSDMQVKSSGEIHTENTAFKTRVHFDACVNGGLLETSVPNNPSEDIKCKCPPKFYGQFCEKCDFCVNGKCNLMSKSLIQCNCDRGYNGSRCEHDMCYNFCLNGGTCSVENQTEPICNCKTAAGNYQGSRCEIDCNLFCQNNPTSDIYDSGRPVCLCGKNGLYVASGIENVTVSHFADEKSSSLEMQLRFGLIGAGGVIIVFVIAIACLLNSVMKLRRRPRIKKRIIVKKNVTPTPLTSRPSADGEQCEITIENCCNMNICETPCYEPQLRTSDKSVSKTEEKKNLLRNMEEGESGSPSHDTLY